MKGVTLDAAEVVAAGAEEVVEVVEGCTLVVLVAARAFEVVPAFFTQAPCAKV